MKGLLPHFVTRQKANGRKRGCPAAELFDTPNPIGYEYCPSPPNKWIPASQGTEFSTIDTALYYHGMLLAAHILGEEEIAEALVREIKGIKFAELYGCHLEMYTPGRGEDVFYTNNLPVTDFITMGIDSQSGKLLDNSWGHWGGETVLVLCMLKMAGAPGPYKMSLAGEHEGATRRPFMGRGFIAEIQSLFYPDFNSADRLDRLTSDSLLVAGLPMTGMNWSAVRQNLLKEQQEMTKRWTNSLAARLSLYGYSSGEDIEEKRYYLENGLRRGGPPPDHTRTNVVKVLPPKPLIFPHYLMMSACTPVSPDGPIAALQALENHGLFPPWGLVENFDVDLRHSLALISSLNAAFESLGAYHLMCKQKKGSDETHNAIYRAAREGSIFREAISVFFADSGDLSISSSSERVLKSDQQ